MTVTRERQVNSPQHALTKIERESRASEPQRRLNDMLDLSQQGKQADWYETILGFEKVSGTFDIASGDDQ